MRGISCLSDAVSTGGRRGSLETKSRENPNKISLHSNDINFPSKHVQIIDFLMRRLCRRVIITIYKLPREVVTAVGFLTESCYFQEALTAFPLGLGSNRQNSRDFISNEPCPL